MPEGELADKQSVPADTEQSVAEDGPMLVLLGGRAPLGYSYGSGDLVHAKDDLVRTARESWTISII